jgi:hypothetical protein
MLRASAMPDWGLSRLPHLQVATPIHTPIGRFLKHNRLLTQQYAAGYPSLPYRTERCITDHRQKFAEVGRFYDVPEENSRFPEMGAMALA